jgi:hypothetical protein
LTAKMNRNRSLQYQYRLRIARVIRIHGGNGLQMHAHGRQQQRRGVAIDASRIAIDAAQACQLARNSRIRDHFVRLLISLQDVSAFAVFVDSVGTNQIVVPKGVTTLKTWALISCVISLQIEDKQYRFVLLRSVAVVATNEIPISLTRNSNKMQQSV